MRRTINELSKALTKCPPDCPANLHALVCSDVSPRALSRDEITAITIALDELESYWDAVGRESSLDEEEIPWDKIPWAIKTLRGLVGNTTT